MYVFGIICKTIISRLQDMSFFRKWKNFETLSNENISIVWTFFISHSSSELIDLSKVVFLTSLPSQTVKQILRTCSAFKVYTLSILHRIKTLLFYIDNNYLGSRLASSNSATLLSCTWSINQTSIWFE